MRRTASIGARRSSGARLGPHRGLGLAGVQRLCFGSLVNPGLLLGGHLLLPAHRQLRAAQAARPRAGLLPGPPRRLAAAQQRLNASRAHRLRRPSRAPHGSRSAQAGRASSVARLAQAPGVVLCALGGGGHHGLAVVPRRRVRLRLSRPAKARLQSHGCCVRRHAAGLPRRPGNAPAPPAHPACACATPGSPSAPGLCAAGPSCAADGPAAAPARPWRPAALACPWRPAPAQPAGNAGGRSSTQVAGGRSSTQVAA